MEMFPGVDIEAELVNLEVVDWPADPWTRGGVSVVPKGRYQARADLAAPTPPLFWAGEATHTAGYAECVHGALESGRRAAYEVAHATQPAYASQGQMASRSTGGGTTSVCGRPVIKGSLTSVEMTRGLKMQIGVRGS